MTATAAIPPAKVEKPEAMPPRDHIGFLGPAVLVAAAGIGASDIVAASVAGAGFGLALLWAIAAVLLCLNDKSHGTAPRPGRSVQAILWAVLLLFLVIAFHELLRLRP